MRTIGLWSTALILIAQSAHATHMSGAFARKLYDSIKYNRTEHEPDGGVHRILDAVNDQGQREKLIECSYLNIRGAWQFDCDIHPGDSYR